MINRDYYKYLEAKDEYERLERQIEEIETRIASLGIDYSKVKVQTTPNNDKLADNIDKLNELKAEAQAKQDNAIKYMQDVIRVIESIQDETLRDIMQRKYIEGESLITIAEDKGYSYRHIQRLHKEAYKKADKL